MKVLVVGPDRNDPGGVSNFYNAVFPRLSGEGVEAHYLEVGSTHGGRAGLHIIGDQIRFWRMLGKLKPDIVHLNPSLDARSFFRDGLFMFQSKLRGRQVLVFIHGWRDSFEEKITGLLKWFFAATYGRADRFIVLAKRFANCLSKWGVAVPIDLGTTTIDDCLLDGFSIDEKAGSFVNMQEVRLLYISRLEPEKGALELVTAVYTLMKNGTPLMLTIAGDGPAMERILFMVSGMGEHRKNINIAGYVHGQKKTDILKSHHLFCFPTQYGEGMPISVLEAMAFGMPVITCPVGGLADFFEDEKMGVLIETNEPGLIAESITRLVSDRQHMVEVSQYNYHFAQRRFLSSIAAGELRVCYRSMCHESPGSK